MQIKLGFVYFHVIDIEASRFIQNKIALKICLVSMFQENCLLLVHTFMFTIVHGLIIHLAV